MTADDDPEQRIRDLERGLTNRAAELSSSASEQGTPQYGYADSPPPPYIPSEDAYPPPPPVPPPPPPGVGAYEAAFGSAQPGGYGSGFPPPPAYTRGPVIVGGPIVRSSSSFRWAWLLFAGIPLIGFLITGIVFFMVFRTANDVTSQYESFMPSGIPSVSIDVPAPPGQPDPVVPTATSSAAPVSVSGVSNRQDVVCDGGVVQISGVSNTVQITGHCAEVSVAGVENVVSIESADKIGASGFTNRVTYRTGSPVVSATGDNVVEQR